MEASWGHRYLHLRITRLYGLQKLQVEKVAAVDQAADVHFPINAAPSKSVVQQANIFAKWNRLWQIQTWSLPSPPPTSWIKFQFHVQPTADVLRATRKKSRCTLEEWKHERNGVGEISSRGRKVGLLFTGLKYFCPLLPVPWYSLFLISVIINVIESYMHMQSHLWHDRCYL